MAYLHGPQIEKSAAHETFRISTDANIRMEISYLKKHIETQAGVMRKLEKAIDALSDRITIQEAQLDGLYEINNSILTQLKEFEAPCSPEEEDPIPELLGPAVRGKVTHVTKGNQI